ncbi:MAG TPA: transglycosylase domain-containing protein [Saprospiraceae bacterium]|nr:transglycosylase domain-containing protein [Saprospiraceae bacterium]
MKEAWAKLKALFRREAAPTQKQYRLVMSLWLILLSLILGSSIFFFALSNSDLPTFEELENPKYDLASIIYDTHGTPYGKYYIENREFTKYKDINPNIIHAVVSTEDERFYRHSGIDASALFRVAIKTLLLSKESSGGGSTITQQLAKLLYDRPDTRGMGFIKRTWVLVMTKFKEWITAVKLERAYTKEEILAMYLSKFEFIHGAHGIQAAAETYFDKNQDKLDVSQSAVLVGMLKNPSLYNPIRFPQKAKDRRNTVLSQMLKFDEINQTQFDTLTPKDIDVSHFKRSEQSDGPAPYFRAELTKWLRDLFEKENITKPDGTPYNIYVDGLKIYTTIDLEYQKLAEKAVWEHMKWLQGRYFNVWKNMNPWTYDADQAQKEIRADILNRRVKASDRYLSLRDKYLAETLDLVHQHYQGLPLSDNVLNTLRKIDAGKSSLKNEVKENSLESEYEGDYQKFLNSKYWPELDKNFSTLEDAFKTEFNKPFKMMVFDYNEQGEKEVEMTPLDSVKYHNQHLQAGMLAVDPHTGYIKAWVGGVDHKYFKYDHVTSRRSVGSTIKPFVYTTAIALQGVSPCQTFDDIQYTIAPGDANFQVDKEWSPANANGIFTGNKYNLYQGLLYSKNSITVRLVKEMGNVTMIRELLDNCGIDKDYTLSNGRLAVPNLPSICLGAVDLTLYDMTGAYTAFANNGTYTEPIFVTRIEDNNGKVIYTGIPHQNKAINPLYNAVMVDMLRNNVGGKFGLGIKTPAGGKTGTTNDYADGWFMCITPDLVVGVWSGGDDKWIRFTNLDDGQGYVMARPATQKFLKALEKDTVSGFDTDARFPSPPPGYFDLINCEKFKEVLPEDEQNQILEQKKQRDVFDDEFDEEF